MREQNEMHYVFVVKKFTGEIIAYDVICNTECCDMNEMFDEDISNAIYDGRLPDGLYEYVVTTKRNCDGLVSLEDYCY